MCTKLKVTLENSAGELVVNAREAESDQAARDAAIEMLEAVPFLSEGDVVRVTRS